MKFVYFKAINTNKLISTLIARIVFFCFLNFLRSTFIGAFFIEDNFFPNKYVIKVVTKL